MLNNYRLLQQLREQMATHGFESNDDYAFPVRCWLAHPTVTVRCLNVSGDSGRRKTAFATALGKALAIPYLLYYDFTQHQEDLPAPPPDPEADLPVINPFDRIVSEACAYSEGDDTLLILDQLQAAHFRQHIRLYEFLKTALWQYPGTTFVANPKHLLIFLLSEEPLYHSLQKHSFRVWVGQVSHAAIPYQPSEFGLDESALPLFAALAALFATLGMMPTRSEYHNILYDLQHYVHHIDHLRHALYGWMEGIDRPTLFSPQLTPLLLGVLEARDQYLGHFSIDIQATPEL